MLPASYRYLLPEPGPKARPGPGLPENPIDCAKCRRVEEGTAEPATKCCDVWPRFPNFLVGELLCAGAPALIEAWIDAGRGDPFGLEVPPEIVEKHLKARSPGRFGLPCPLLEDGRCSIYARRPLPCVDYHCLYPSGLQREAYACLSSALMLLAQRAERGLALSFDLDSQRMGEVLQLPDDVLWVNDAIEASSYEALWQHWQGREREFYQACFRRLAKGWMSPSEVALAPPTPAQRKTFSEGAVPAHKNPVEPEALLGVLLWYQRKLESPMRRILRVLW